MGNLAAHLPLAEILIRAVATIVIVVSVATAVGRLGPVIGGLVAGLPVGLGPGFFFLLDDASEEFLTQTAISSLLALSATQVFLLSYMATAKHGRPFLSLALAVFIWWASIALFSTLPAHGVLATLLFGVVTAATRRLGRSFLMHNTQKKSKESFSLLLLRASTGGFLVACVTVFATYLGAHLAGILLAFPIGYALISVTIHEQFGSPAVISVVHSAIFGTITLATFCVALGTGLLILAPSGAFTFALIASVTSTVLMTSAARKV